MSSPLPQEDPQPGPPAGAQEAPKKPPRSPQVVQKRSQEASTLPPSGHRKASQETPIGIQEPSDPQPRQGAASKPPGGPQEFP